MKEEARQDAPTYTQLTKPEDGGGKERMGDKRKKRKDDKVIEKSGCRGARQIARKKLLGRKGKWGAQPKKG